MRWQPLNLFEDLTLYPRGVTDNPGKVRQVWLINTISVNFNWVYPVVAVYIIKRSKSGFVHAIVPYNALFRVQMYYGTQKVQKSAI